MIFDLLLPVCTTELDGSGRNMQKNQVLRTPALRGVQPIMNEVVPSVHKPELAVQMIYECLKA